MVVTLVLEFFKNCDYCENCFRDTSPRYLPIMTLNVPARFEILKFAFKSWKYLFSLFRRSYLATI